MVQTNKDNRVVTGGGLFFLLLFLLRRGNKVQLAENEKNKTLESSMAASYKRRQVGQDRRSRARGGGVRLMYKDVPQQLVGGWPLLGLHEDPPKELAAVVRHVSGQHGVGWLCGDFEDGCHGLKLGPWGALRQHLHYRATHTPVRYKTMIWTTFQKLCNKLYYIVHFTALLLVLLI